MDAASTIAEGPKSGAGNQIVELSDYVFHSINEDEELILSRGHPQNTKAASILLLAPASLHPRPETLKKIEHEYSFASELEPAWAVRPITLSRHKGQSALVLQDPGGELLSRLIRGPMEMGIFLRLAICLANALGHLHKRHLIHKDLKPSNILADPAKPQVWLTGFGIASRLPRERQPLEPPEFIAGTLAYMAPEQTGRMNRSMDSRSDLYTLGVTLYEMLTGNLPFTASDPMEWVHCHIAKQPIPPNERVPNIPGTVSAIVVKLLAKTAEERYQTALGVAHDLRRCLDEWETHKDVDEFPLGEHDTPDRLLIREKLYGREGEIETLLTSFDRIVAGERPELVLVSGYSGIGKSAVVNELHKSLVPPRALFASGKFDQYKRDIPYSTLAQAFQGLLRPLLTKSEGELQKWRDVLQEALGPNGQLIVDLVPVLKLIIGEQPLAPDLPPQDAQGRFQLVLRRFISVFARPEHPLALFLDDLQWLDAATLDLIEDLMTRPDVRHLMLIGAYRDNEVNPSHPLMRKLEAIRQTGAIVHNIVLDPLSREDLQQLVADSLQCELERASPLAQVIHEKTTGNPFFAIQFFSALVDQALLTFDHGEGRWSWDLGRIHAEGYTDNVVDLMVGKLNRLPVETQNALEQLACLGNSAEFAMLRILYQDSNEGMHAQLWEAVRAGLIFRSEDSYRFLHDRVQEAAYSLISEDSRAETHLRIGKLLIAHTSPDKVQEGIFEIVNQLNRATALITSGDERKQLAELNLIAGKRSKASTAYASALKYLVAGSTALGDDSWERLHELSFQLELCTAECEFLTGQLAVAEQRLSALLSRAADNVERATVASLQADLYTTLDQIARAVAVCLDYLRHLGLKWSAHPTDEEVRREYDRIWSQLGSRAIEELIDLPSTIDPEFLATLDVLTRLFIPALFTDANLLSLAICTAVNLSLELGNSDASCVAYVWLGQIAGPHFGSYEAGFRFGQLGYELVERGGLKRFEARTLMVFGHHVMPWTKHVRAGRDLLRRAFETANKIGDLTFAAYSCINLNTNCLIAGDPLGEVQQEAMNGLLYTQTVRFGFAVDHISSQLGLIRTLRGVTPKFGSFNDDQFDELRFEGHLASDPALAQAECYYWIRKLQARFLAGDYSSALDASFKAQRLLWSTPSNLERTEYEYYGALSHAASWDSASPDQRQKHFEALATNHQQLEIWAKNCPENFENRATLVGAEIARIEGRLLDAEQLYEKAIRSAHTNGFIHNEALANETAARFYAARGLDKIAEAHLREARYGYLRWEADGKVKQLDELYPHLSKEEPVRGMTSTIVAPGEFLDLATVIKVSQAISGEMVLENLIDRIMRAAIEHAGATRGLLMLPQSDELQIKAEITTSGNDVRVDQRNAAVTATVIPESLVRYVVRTREYVILEDAATPNPFSADPYIAQHHARSIVCLPVVSQGRLNGIIYLENNLAAHVFTSDRITVLKVFASQAAISLENTRLYRDLENREKKIRRLVDANILGITMWNIDGAIVASNQAFLEMVNYEPDDLATGRVRWKDMTPPEWAESAERALAEVIQNGTVQPFESELFRKDGSRVPVLVAGALFEEGGSEGVAFTVDLTEKKRAEEALRRSENYLTQAQQLARIGSWAWQIPSRKAIYISEEWYRIYGLDPKEGMPDWEQRLGRVHAEDRARFQATIEQAIAEKSGYDVEFRILSPDSPGKYIHSVGHPILGSSGELEEFVGVSMDVTESKQAEEAFRLIVVGTAGTTGSDFFPSLVQHLAQALRTRYAFVTTCDDQKHARLLAFWKGDGFGENFEFDIADTPCEKVLHGEVCHYPQGLQVLFPRDKILANWQAESYLGLPMLDSSNRVIGHIAILDDKPMEADLRAIDLLKIFASRAAAELKRQKAEDELQAALQDRERLRRAQADLAHISRVSTMGELTASLAHEIKQPIGAAVTNAETCARLLDRDQPDIIDAREAALEMVKDVRRAAEIIDRVRLLYQKGSSKLDVVDINEIIREMVNMLQNEATRDPVAMRTDLAEGLPEVMADRVQLQQVLMNLMLNGIEAMQSATGELSIKSQLAEDGQLLISVSDTGVGLPTENADKIFDAFFTTKSQGTGLGLAISRSIIESQGGRIWATRNAKRGATFHFTLPNRLSVAA